MAVTNHLKRLTLTLELTTEKPTRISYSLFLSPCFQLGFTEPKPLDFAGALLTHLCTLTFSIIWFKYLAIGLVSWILNKLWSRRYFSVALSSRSLTLGIIQQFDSVEARTFLRDFLSLRNHLRLLFCIYINQIYRRIYRTTPLVTGIGLIKYICSNSKPLPM